MGRGKTHTEGLPEESLLVNLAKTEQARDFKSPCVTYRRRSGSQDEEFPKVKSSSQQVSWVAARGSEFPVIGVYLCVRMHRLMMI